MILRLDSAPRWFTDCSLKTTRSPEIRPCGINSLGPLLLAPFLTSADSQRVNGYLGSVTSGCRGTGSAHGLDRLQSTRNTFDNAQAHATIAVSGPYFRHHCARYVPGASRPWAVCRGVRADVDVSGAQSFVSADVLDRCGPSVLGQLWLRGYDCLSRFGARSSRSTHSI